MRSTSRNRDFVRVDGPEWINLTLVTKMVPVFWKSVRTVNSWVAFLDHKDHELARLTTDSKEESIEQIKRILRGAV